MEIIKINLLSPENIKHEENMSAVWLSIFLVVIAAGLGAVIFYLKLSSLDSLNSQIKIAQAEMSKYDNTVRQVTAVESARKILETKKAVINSLRDQGIIYPRFMEDLVSILPSGISIKTLFTKLSPEGKLSVTLSADSTDNYPIADLITQLTLNNSFSDIELGTISTARSANMPTISSFSLSFNYQRKVKNVQ